MMWASATLPSAMGGVRGETQPGLFVAGADEHRDVVPAGAVLAGGVDSVGQPLDGLVDEAGEVDLIADPQAAAFGRVGDLVFDDVVAVLVDAGRRKTAHEFCPWSSRRRRASEMPDARAGPGPRHQRSPRPGADGGGLQD